MKSALFVVFAKFSPICNYSAESLAASAAFSSEAVSLAVSVVLSSEAVSLTVSVLSVASAVKLHDEPFGGCEFAVVENRVERHVNFCAEEVRVVAEPPHVIC